jgi:5'-3' exonuclease
MTSRLVEYFLTVSHGSTLEPVSSQADGTQATQLTQEAAKKEQQRLQQQAIHSSRTNSSLQTHQQQQQQQSSKSPAATTQQQNNQTLSGSATPLIQSSQNAHMRNTSTASGSFIDRVYKGQIVDRYPAVDHEDCCCCCC